MISEAFVVDTRDGYVWQAGADGKLFTEETAAAYARNLNEACREGHRTLIVCKPVILDIDVAADAPGTAPDPEPEPEASSPGKAAEPRGRRPRGAR